MLASPGVLPRVVGELPRQWLFLYLPAEIQQQDRDGALVEAKEERPTEEVPPFLTNRSALPHILLDRFTG